MQAPGLGDEGEELLGQLQDRDMGEVNLLGPGEGEKDIERPRIAIDVDDQGSIEWTHLRRPVESFVLDVHAPRPIGRHI